MSNEFSYHHRYIVFTVEGKKRVKLGEFQGASFDLTKCAGGEYPDTEDRLQYMHSFALSQNYVILPLTSYLMEYCQIMGMLGGNFMYYILSFDFFKLRN